MTLSDNTPSIGSVDDSAWSEMAELSFTDDETNCPPPASTPCADAEHEHQPLIANRQRADSGCHKLPASADSLACDEEDKEDRRSRTRYSKANRDVSYGSSASIPRMELSNDNSPYKDRNSVPRSLLPELPELPELSEPPSMMELALRSVQQVFKTGLRSSVGSLSTKPPKNTLQRCWGALKETLDELGNIWDEDDGDNEHRETVGSGVESVRSVSAPVTPARQNPRESMTPQTRLLPGTMGSRPSHYDTLACSPVASSRSSKRKPKPRLRYKSPIPRRKDCVDIDHAYSTEDESSDPHLRLLNRILFPDPSCPSQEDLYIFMYKQDNRTGCFDLNPENAKPVTNSDREETPAGDAGSLPDWSRALVANASDSPAGRSARQSVANLLTGECQHGVQRCQQTCEICDKIESGPARPHIDENSSTPLVSQTDVDSRARRLVSDSEAMVSDSTQKPEAMHRNDHRVPTPDNLRKDVKEIFSGHANGNKAVDRKGPPASKLKLSERIKEALRPQDPDLLKYKPGLAKWSDAQPPINSHFRMSDDGTVHRVVEHPPTISSDTDCDAGYQLTDKAKTGIPKAEGGRVSEWLGRIEPGDDGPDDLSSKGSIPPEFTTHRPDPVLSKVPVVEVTPKSKKAKRRPQVPESCTVLSARIPPERDITDLFRTPFATFEQELRELSLNLPNPPPRDTLMSEFGVSYGIAAANHDNRLPVPAAQQESADPHLRSGSTKVEEDLMSSFGVLCISAPTRHDVTNLDSPANDVMSQSAAMGPLSALSRINDETRLRNAEIDREKQDTAHAINASWLELDDAKKMPCCWKPPTPVSRLRNEHRAIRVYNLQNMFQGIASRTPLRVIAQWLSMDEWNYRMQYFLKNA